MVMSTPEVTRTVRLEVADKIVEYSLSEEAKLHVLFHAEDGRTFAAIFKPPSDNDPPVMGRRVHGRNYVFDVHPISFLCCNKRAIPEAAAVQYSSELGVIVLMRRAENRMGGLLLNTRPESSCRYRPLGKEAVLIPIKEIDVAF